MSDVSDSFKRISEGLEFVYGPEQAPEIFQAIQGLVSRYTGAISARASSWSERDAFLITYADSILGDGPPLEALHQFLRRHVGDSISFVHLLPFFPSTSDDGFAVSDFRSVREDLGDWGHIASLALDYRLVFDAVINHASSSGLYMKGYETGDPKFADFFVALDPSTDTSQVLRTRNLPLLHDYPTHEGVKWLWTTFSRDQLDLNYRNPKVFIEMLDVLLSYARNGASMIRLDAIPYLWKELGTSCAHLPQTHRLIKLLRDVYDTVAPHVLLLTETNVPHQENVSYFGDHGDEAQMIYNFSLAPLILWSLLKGDASILGNWARGLKFISPRATYLNITATHDGIGMRPTEGILSHDQRMELVQMAVDHGGDVTGKRNSDGSVSPYELNVNYFDAVNDPRSDEPTDLKVRRFMVSQSIPMVLMGMPGIYIHSLLGSQNDTQAVKLTGRARSINRQQLQFDTLRDQLADLNTVRSKVFAAFLNLLGMRAKQSAFHPDAQQEILDLGATFFAVRRVNIQTGQVITALHNVSNRLLNAPLAGTYRDLLSPERFEGASVPLVPYQIRWLVGG